MKTLFTLLLTVGSLTSVFAQYNKDYKNDRSGRNDNNTTYESGDNNGGSKPIERQDDYDKNNDKSYRNNDKKDYAYNDRRSNESFSMNYREKEFQIQRINREYNYRISSVSADRYLSFRQKNWQIRNLERQRHDEIRNIEAHFNNNRNRYSDGRSGRW